MTNRRVRTRPPAQSYTARLQRQVVFKPRRQPPAWLRARWLLAGLVLVAEAGHLAAAATQWPALLSRGVWHLLIAAALGFVAAGILSGPTDTELRAGLAASSIALTWWLVGSLAGASPYRGWPVFAVGALSILDLVVAVLLTVDRGSAAGRASSPGRGRQVMGR